jgi:hypothetical protein
VSRIQLGSEFAAEICHENYWKARGDVRARRVERYDWRVSSALDCLGIEYDVPAVLACVCALDWLGFLFARRHRSTKIKEPPKQLISWKREGEG